MWWLNWSDVDVPVDIICPFAGLIFLCGVIKLGVVRSGGAGCRRAGVRGYRPAPPPDPEPLSFRARVAQSARVAPRLCHSLDSPLQAFTMLIGLVRDSVMQCFCHSCRAPVLPAGWEQRAGANSFLTNSSLPTGDAATLTMETNALSSGFSTKRLAILIFFTCTRNAY